jgi:hypothetical protein
MCRYRYSCQRSRVIRRPLINSKSHRLTHEFLDDLPPFYIKKGKTTRCLASLNINGAVEAGKHPAFTLALCRLVDFTRFGASLAVIVFLAVFVGSLMFDFALVLPLLSVTTDGRQPRQWCDT